MYAYLLFRKKANAHTPKGMDYITNTLGKLSLITSSRVNNQLARLPFCKNVRNIMEYSRAKIDLINMAAVWYKRFVLPTEIAFIKNITEWENY